jgi:competence protein CoiA
VTLLQIGMTHSGELIELWRFQAIESLNALRSTHSFHCPHCSKPLILRLGTQKVPHFAHESIARCDPNYESESMIHFTGKKLIYELLAKENRAVEMEKHFPEIAQRADVFTSNGNCHYAIEFQCSSISSNLLTQRTKGYQRIGVVPYWLLGPPLANQLSFSKIRLSPFQSLFIKYHPLLGFWISQLDPSTETIYFYPHLMPISTSIFSTRPYRISIHKISFPFLPDIQLHQSSLRLSDWLVIKEKLIINTLKFSHRKKEPLLYELYEAGASIHMTPSYVGIPVKNGILMGESFFKWQAFLWLDIFSRKQMGELICKEEVVRAIDLRIKKGSLKLRKTPLVLANLLDGLVDQYLEVLVKTDVLKKENNEWYSIKHVNKPRTIQEHIQSQKEFISKYEEL